jgi:hypothetical protein
MQAAQIIQQPLSCTRRAAIVHQTVVLALQSGSATLRAAPTVCLCLASTVRNLGVGRPHVMHGAMSEKLPCQGPSIAAALGLSCFHNMLLRSRFMAWFMCAEEHLQLSKSIGSIRGQVSMQCTHTHTTVAPRGAPTLAGRYAMLGVYRQYRDSWS